jgi:hypothetical protein
MIEIVQFESSYKSGWDDFIRKSKNGSFLFYRDYMEYHSDRFQDSSFLFFKDDVLIAVMPANVSSGVLYSHKGLTFGGIISNKQMKIELMLGLVACLMEHLNEQRITTWIYKAVPHIYHVCPAEEDLYALFRYDARLIRRDVSSTIRLAEQIGFSKNKRRRIKQGEREGLTVRRNSDFKEFMSIQEAVLRENYDTRPTHTATEIESLARRFPENIKLFAAYKQQLMTGGIIVYETGRVAHIQYVASNSLGKRIGTVESILDYLINDYYSDKDYFDFGISTEMGGAYLNCGLAAYKEGFGARTIAYDTYQINVANNEPL